ncbi:MAG: OpgC family protein [Gemmatimonas sp.]
MSLWQVPGASIRAALPPRAGIRHAAETPIERARDAALPGGRDPRIDLVRGLALWMIFADHVPADVFGRYTFGHVALADALDIFIFLSGLSCAVLYGRLLRTASFARAQSRALRRVGQLYVANLCLALMVVAVYVAFKGVLDRDYVTTYDLGLLAAEPVRAIVAMAALAYTPQMTDILPLYMILVAATPSLLWLMTRSAPATLALAAAAWLAAALVPGLNVPGLGASGAASFNPLSWQLLFCVGLWAGTRRYLDGVPFRRRGWLVATCWLVMLAGFVARHAVWLGIHEPHLLWAAAAADDRVGVALVRLANLCAAAYLVAITVRADSPWLTGRWASPLVLCGRHSLQVFCAGVGASLLGIVAVRTYGEGLAVQLAVNGGGLAAMLVAAWLAEGRRVTARRSVPLAAGGAAHPRESI